jgi:predicted ATPase
VEAVGVLGTSLNNRYRLDAEVGRGGMGTVYRAHDTLLARDVAVKVLSATGLGTEGRARLLREAQAVAQLNHPNVVTIHDVGEAGGSPFIVMEWLAGRSLYDTMVTQGREAAGLGGPEGLDRILLITRQVCTALEHAHAHGIVHRDLKPENVLLLVNPLDDASPVVKLVDFGLSRSVASRLTPEGSLAGTVFYLAPEQALGQPVDPRADLYALGVLLYELLCGRLPFVADDPLAVISQHLYAPVRPPRALEPEIPPVLSDLVVRLLSKRPEERPASATAVRQALEELGREPAPLLDAELSPLDQLVRGRLVGREVEFAEARAAWKEASSAPGRSRVLLITGEPGSGKTPLVREIRTLAEVTGGRALVASCYAEGTAPYAPIAQFIREALSLQALELPDLVLAGLMDLAPDLRAHYPDVPALTPLDAHADRQRLFESVVALCGALVERAPLLWVVEDAQWADSGTLFLLRHLAQRSRSMGFRVLLVLTYREVELGESCCLSDVLMDLHRLGQAVRIKLGRLNRAQTGELLAVLLQGEIPDAFLDAIYRETEGNPLFVEEICKALMEDGHLHREGGRWHWSLDRLRLPQSISMAIQARISRLPAATQEVLPLAAVIGRAFDFKTLCRAGDLEEEDVIHALEAAERAQLLVEMDTPRGAGSQEMLAFAHKVTRSALLESLSGLRRRRMHRRVADAIRELRPDDLEALAYHYGEAGDEERSLTYHLRAADRARRVYANDDAIRLYTEALHLMPDDHPGRFDALAARAGVYDVVARREEQLADAQAMLALADASHDDARRCDALIALTDYYLETEPALAQEPAAQSVALAKTLGDPLREGQALRRLGREARYRYDFALSRSALEAAIARFRQADCPSDTAVCLHMLSLTLGEQGETEAALQAAQDALAASRVAADRRQEAISLRRLAIVHLGIREHAKALPFATAALALHRELGDRSEEARALNVLGVISGWLGRAEEARQYLEQALDLSMAIDSSLGVRSAVINLLWAYYRWLGDYEAALSFLQEQVTCARRLGDEVLEAHLRSQEPFLLAVLGQYEAALEAVQSLLPTLERLLGAGNHSHYLAFAGRMEAEMGHPDRARAYLETALAQAQENGTAMDIANARHSLAYAALREGGAARLRSGLEQATEAIELLRGAKAVDERAEALHTAAQLHLAVSEGGLPATKVAEHREAALACSTEALQITATWPVTPQAYLYTHARALRAAGHDAEAEEPLRRAHERVLSVAAQIRDETLRRGWLDSVRLNREILRAWVARED